LPPGADGPIGHHESILGRDHARDVDNQPHTHTELRLGPGSSAVEGRQLLGKAQLLLPEVREGGVGDLGIADVLGCLSGQELAHDQLNIVGRAHALQNCQVDFDEVRKVGEGIPGAPAVHAVGRQRDAVAARQPQQGGGLDRTFQVDVQLQLGHGANNVVGQHRG
jgi:hypothetical protein